MSITECPRCGYHLASTPREDVSALQAEARRLEDLISRLQEEKIALLRRINNAEDKTRHLPFEVLSSIFQFARPPIDFTANEPELYDVDDPDCPSFMGYHDPDEDFHHTLAAVSHRWRRVALSTPQLWTSISLIVLNIFTEFDVSLLELHFKNAGNLPIAIRLDFSNLAVVWDKNPSRRSDFLGRLGGLEDTVFVEHADRVRSLFLVRPPTEWCPDGGSLTRCHSATIYWPDSQPYHPSYFYFEDFPCLQHVNLIGSPILFSLPASLSTLQLRGIEPDLQSLAELPNLVKLEITDVWIAALSPGLNDSVVEPVVFPGLENLTWSGHLDHNHSLLRYVRFDNLRILEWHEDQGYYTRFSDEGRRLRLSFFSSLPTTLSSLTLGSLNVDSLSVVDLLDSVPQLTELYFVNCPYEAIVEAANVIGRPRSNRGASSSPSNVLPSLCVLSISGTSIWDTRLNPSMFIEMLATLHAAGSRPKRFHLATDSDVGWDSDALGEVRELIASGLDAKVSFVSCGLTTTEIY